MTIAEEIQAYIAYQQLQLKVLEQIADALDRRTAIAQMEIQTLQALTEAVALLVRPTVVQ